MSAGLGLLNKLIVDSVPIGKLDELGIKASSFNAGGETKVFEFVRSHFQSYGEMPKKKTVVVETKVNLDGFPIDEPLMYWVDKLKEREKSKIIINSAEAMKEAVNVKDVGAAIIEARSLALTLSEMDAIGDKIVGLQAVVDDVLTAHNRRQMEPDLGGITMGFPSLDALSDGAMPGDTIAIVARPNIGKTWLLLHMLLSAYKQGSVPLIHSMEMPPIQIMRRILAMNSKTSATKIKFGKLSFFAMKKLLSDFEKLKNEEAQGRPFHFLKGSMKSTIDDLVLRVQELKPSAVYIDGAYLLKVSGRGQQSRTEKVSETAEKLKAMSIDFDIPVFSTYQFNRIGPRGGLGSIGLSDTIGQLASIVLSLEDENNIENDGYQRERQYKKLKIIKGREGEWGEFRILYDMATATIAEVRGS